MYYCFRLLLICFRLRELSVHAAHFKSNGNARMNCGKVADLGRHCMVCDPVIFFFQIKAFGREIALIPVISVLAVTAIKDAVEDYRRYQQDTKVNTSTAQVYSK